MPTPAPDLDSSADALATLSPEDQQALHLTYSAGLGHEQVANLLGISPDAAASRVRDSVIRLREAIAAVAA